jgi:hypothetical protein
MHAEREREREREREERERETRGTKGVRWKAAGAGYRDVFYK